ncbi:MAG: xanthine dehydrogenase family protein subunit M [Rhodospirillales bacterium]|nr:xanthine dehydrogenase family protein subunit M [Rhodospirillales bacterium]
MQNQTRPLAPFEYFAPGSLKEALTLLQELGAGVQLLAGGTDMIQQLKDRVVRPEAIVDLRNVEELSIIEIKGDTLHIGATATLNEIKNSPDVQQMAPLVVEASREFGSHMLRNRATVGGNLCNASPCADLAPPLLALDASVLLRGMDAERLVPLTEFFVGAGETVLRPGEMLQRIEVPCRDGRSGYLKLGRRKGFNLSIVSVAAFGATVDGKVEDIKVALGAVAPTPIRSTKAEAELSGNAISEAAIDRAAQMVRQDVQAEADIREATFSHERGSATFRRASSPYRVEISEIMARRVLTGILNGEGAGK